MLNKKTRGSILELQLNVNSRTGQVANPTSFFPVGNGGDNNPAHFIFATLNGTIAAWNTGATAFTQPQATTPGAVYTGLAISQNLAQPLLYAANNAAGRIDVFNGSFQLMNNGAFATPAAIQQAGLVPFATFNSNQLRDRTVAKRSST
jgi:hypothetical protein